MEQLDYDMQVDALSEDLHRALAKERGVLSILLDPSLRPLNVDSDFDAALLALKPRYVPSLSNNLEPSLMPLFVELDSRQAAGSGIIRDSIGEALVECEPGSLAHGAGRRICGWMEVSCDADFLARHIARHLIQRRPNGTRTLLRWTDPAVLWALWPRLESEQQQALLGPIAAYHLLDPAGRWLVLQRIENNVSIADLNLTIEQWAEADAIQALNKILLECGAAYASEKELVAMRETGFSALRRARLLGFNDSNDLAAFGYLAVTVHAEFDSHSSIVELLLKREVDDYFTALICDIGSEEWQRIRADLNGQNTQSAARP